MNRERFSVGIVGLQPGRSWGARAHVPALQSLSDDYNIVGVANSSRESGEAAAAAMGLSRAFSDVHALIGAPDVDIVVVTVRVPNHLELVNAALEAGKHVYCEWPLGNGLEEAEEMASLAEAKGLLGVVGTQARVSPEIMHLKHLIANGYLGDVLATTLVARGGAWGGVITDKKTQAYLLDASNGATMLTIPVGHTLAALQEVLGKVTEVSSILATRRQEAVVAGTNERLPVSAPDQVLVSGLLASGAPLSLHYRGGAPRDGQGLFWEISGTEGEIRISGALGHAQMVPLSLSAARGDEKTFQPIEVPVVSDLVSLADVVPGNVARVYKRMAADLRNGTRTAPTFRDAVALHRTISAIENAAEGGGVKVVI